LSYTREQLLACKGAAVPDLIEGNCKLLFVGINPGLWTAMTGIHFAHPTNRFWPAMKLAGLIDGRPEISPVAPAVRVPSATGTGRPSAAVLSFPQARPKLLMGSLDEVGIGFTNLVGRATARASELTPSELRAGARRLGTLVDVVSPKVVAVSGVTAYRQAFGHRDAEMGKQSESISGVETWVLPNPSGLNAHETVESLSIWYKRVAGAAGIK
jgi:TDG/mug DNA glycosylase family protein